MISVSSRPNGRNSRPPPVLAIANRAVDRAAGNDVEINSSYFAEDHAMTPHAAPEPAAIHVSDEVLDDLRGRLGATRSPLDEGNADWPYSAPDADPHRSR